MCRASYSPSASERHPHCAARLRAGPANLPRPTRGTREKQASTTILPAGYMVSEGGREHFHNLCIPMFVFVFVCRGGGTQANIEQFCRCIVMGNAAH